MKFSVIHLILHFVLNIDLMNKTANLNRESNEKKI